MSAPSPLFGIDPEVLSILRCPACHHALQAKTKGYRCTSCEKTFPVVNNLARFVDAQHYAHTFGYQWHKYARARWGEESEATFEQKTGLSPAELAGKMVLDVGCGTGRFADVVARRGARVVGVDLSAAAEVAAQNLREYPSAAMFQADVFHLPFAPESFDYIYSIGVLHHTPNCEAAFKGLPRLLKPGGQIAIWVYSGYNKYYHFSDAYRKITSRLPAPWLHALCQASGPLYYVYRGLRRIPVVGRPMSRLMRFMLPLALDERDWDLRVLSTFDWYSPKYQSKHTYEEVFRWFESCGLEDVHVVGPPVAVRGRKPARASAQPIMDASVAA